MLSLIAIIAASYEEIKLPPPKERFQWMAPISTLPPIRLDTFANSVGVAQKIAREHKLQARILWIDATANLERTNTNEKITQLVKKIKQSGFNTIVYDVKPIVGFTTYPSKIAPKLTEWRGQSMPLEHDPLAAFVKECKINDIPLFVSLNAFSEGHRMFLLGPGYDMPLYQTVLYEFSPVVRSKDKTFPLRDQVNNIPEGDNEIGVITNVTRIPQQEYVNVSIDRDYNVISLNPSEIPANGSILTGRGNAGRFLTENAQIGEKLEFDTMPVFVRIHERPEQQIPLMMNPNRPEVQKRALDILHEVVSLYDIDGVIYDDRLRYGNWNADFSFYTRALFEKYIGHPITWPDDVFKFTLTPQLSRGIKPGRYYQDWLNFRSLTLRNWLSQAKNLVKKTKPNVLFGVYVGSWYGEYPKFGSNYASPLFDAGFWFLTPEYQRTGFASQLDFLIAGAYYRNATIAEAMERNAPTGNTVEFGGMLANRTTRDQCWTYTGIMLLDYQGNQKEIANALQAACGASQGVMVFDLSHNIEPIWPLFEKAFSQPTKAPHQLPGLLSKVRKEREKLDKSGHKEPPVIVPSGLPGAGL